ncbi:hypothetical protein ACFP81_04270 [Deinococcus lacus]|uniref:Uncharacterized protein n=1 Tax=Deinococcus lacus TaxID=392561 RepID=A0ABW1YAU0_9DEIO
MPDQTPTRPPAPPALPLWRRLPWRAALAVPSLLGAVMGLFGLLGLAATVPPDTRPQVSAPPPADVRAELPQTAPQPAPPPPSPGWTPPLGRVSSAPRLPLRAATVAAPRRPNLAVLGRRQTDGG